MTSTNHSAITVPGNSPMEESNVAIKSWRVSCAAHASFMISSGLERVFSARFCGSGFGTTSPPSFAVVSDCDSALLVSDFVSPPAAFSFASSLASLESLG